MPKTPFHRSLSIAERNLAEMAAKMDTLKCPKIWLQKTINIFKMLDVKNRGYLFQDSYREFAEEVVKQSKMSPEVADEFKSKVAKWFKDTNSKPDNKMSLEQYCKSRYIVVSDPELWEDYRGFLSEAINMTFQVIDSNSDGYLSPEEWAVFHRSIRVFDQSLSDKIFDTIDLDKDGLISMEEFLTAYFEYVSSQESGKYDLMYGPLPDVPEFWGGC